MAVLKNDELEVMNRINKLLSPNTQGFFELYFNLTEEQKADIVKFARLIGKLENDRDMQRIRTKLANREKRKINKDYGRRKQA
jgi:hypothetical protein